VRKIPALPNSPLVPPKKHATIPACRQPQHNRTHQLTSPGPPAKVAAKPTEEVFPLPFPPLPPNPKSLIPNPFPNSPTNSSKTSKTPPSPPSTSATSTASPSSNSPTCSSPKPTNEPSKPSNASQQPAPNLSSPKRPPSPPPASPTSSKTNPKPLPTPRPSEKPPTKSSLPLLWWDGLPARHPKRAPLLASTAMRRPSPPRQSQNPTIEKQPTKNITSSSATPYHSSHQTSRRLDGHAYSSAEPCSCTAHGKPSGAPRLTTARAERGPSVSFR